MKQLKVSDVLRECRGFLFFGNENLVLESFSKDTRTIQCGEVYLGIAGETYDGNDFYELALEKGASCCILDHFSPQNFNQAKYGDRTIIVVDDTIQALQDLAAYKRTLVDIPVVAVTGSVGKTSTKDMIASVLSQKYNVLKTPGNLNGQIGMPLSILHLKDEEVMVLEMGMNDFGHIERLTRVAKPTIGVITNIGTAHIGILGSRENILKAKLEILHGMKAGRQLVINYDNDLLSKLDLPDYEIHTCGIHSDSEYQGGEIEIHISSSDYVVKYHQQQENIQLPVMGEAFVMNSLLAVAVGDLLGLTSQEIKKGLEEFEMVGNRMEIVSLKDKMILINDSYNSNLEALKSVLGVLAKYPGKRKIAVLGDVLEMNEFAESIHEQIGMIPALQLADAIFLAGENAIYIQDGAIKQGFDPNKIFYFQTNEALEQALFQYLEPEDTILVKSSKGMKFSEIADKIKESYRL